MGCKPLGLAVLALILGGCQEGVDTVVKQDATGITFDAVPVRASFKVCIDRIYVYALENGAERQVWYASNGIKTEPCIRSVRYGIMPKGFSGAAVAPRLGPGAPYRVTLFGSGFNSSADFRVN